MEQVPVLAASIAAHAWERHREDFRFVAPAITSEPALARFVADIMESIAPKRLRRGRLAYLHAMTGVVVIAEPPRSGTALVPADPEGYYERLR